MTNPAGSAIVNAVGPIRQIVQTSARPQRRYLVIVQASGTKNLALLCRCRSSEQQYRIYCDIRRIAGGPRFGVLVHPEAHGAIPGLRGRATGIQDLTALQKGRPRLPRTAAFRRDWGCRGVRGDRPHNSIQSSASQAQLRSVLMTRFVHVVTSSRYDVTFVGYPALLRPCLIPAHRPLRAVGITKECPLPST